MPHDLSTVTGVFGYFSEGTNILEPIRVEFERLETENEQLKQDKVTLAQNVFDLTTIVEALLTGGIE